MAGRSFTVADAAVLVGADFKAYDAALGKKTTETRGMLGKLGQAVKDDFGVVLGGAAGGLAAMGLKVGETWDSAFDEIRTSTGKTGAALEALQGDLRDMAGTVEDSIGTQAEVLAALHKRTGQTGESLQALAKTELDLARITKTDVNRNVELSTRLFGDWSIAAADQAATLDKVYRASTETGIGVDDLMEKVVQFGSPLRLLGFGFEESIALLSKWEKEGVNTETALSGLKYSVKTLAAEGVPASDMARVLQERIAAIKTSADPVGDSIELFGLRAGPDLAAAIQEGRFETEDLLEVITNGGDTIEQATKDTEDLGSAWRKLLNSVSSVFGPLAAGAGDLASTLGPLLYAFPALGGAIGKFAQRAGRAGIGALKSGLETLYLQALYLGDAFKSNRFVTKITDGIASAFNRVPGSSRITGALDKVGGALGGKLGAAFAVGFAAAAIFAVVETARQIEEETALQQEAIATAVAEQVATGTIESLKQSKAALEQGIRDWEASPLKFLLPTFSEEEIGKLQTQLDRVNAALEAAGREMPKALSTGILHDNGSVPAALAETVGGAVDMSAGLMLGAAHAVGEELPEEYANGILRKQNAVVDALDQLKDLMANVLSRPKEIARLMGQLTSKALADGLNHNRPAVREEARRVQADAEQRLATLISRGGKVGEDAAAELARKLKSKNPQVRASAQRVKDIVDGKLDEVVTMSGNRGEDAAQAFARRMRAAWARSDFTINAQVGFTIPASFDVGTSYVPADMFAMIHQGEIIVPADESDAIRAGRAVLGQPGAGEGRVGDTYNIPINVQGALPVRTARDVVTELRRGAELGLLPARDLSPKYHRREVRA